MVLPDLIVPVGDVGGSSDEGGEYGIGGHVGLRPPSCPLRPSSVCVLEDKHRKTVVWDSDQYTRVRSEVCDDLSVSQKTHFKVGDLPSVLVGKHRGVIVH